MLHIPGAKYCKIQWGEKKPIGVGWQNSPFEFDQITRGVQKKLHGYGILFGYGDIVGFDIDNAEGRDRFVRFFGCLPKDCPSVSWTSGKSFDGTYSEETTEDTCIQIAFQLSPEQSAQLPGRRVFKGNTLDIRWKGTQSVLPSKSPHPSTKQPYRWHFAPNVATVLTMPDSVWAKIIAELYQQQPELNPEVQEAKRREREERKAERQSRRLSSGNLSDSLGDILERDILPRLSTDDIYNWGHNWKRQANDRWEGNCPNHQSKSGAGFVVTPSANTWFCNGCSVGGGAVQYRFFVKGGNGSPRGKDFVEVVKELASDAGVELPKWEPPTTTPEASDEKKAEQQADWLARKGEADFERWKRLKKFTPTETVNQQFLNIEFKMGQCLGVGSGTGTGKTAQVIRISIIHKVGFINIGSRNCLMQNTSGRCCEAGLNSYWIHEEEVNIFIPDADSAIHLCIDSLMRIDADDARGKLIVIDETISVIFHALASSTCERQRLPMLKRLDEVLSVAGGVILLDANLNDWIFDAVYQRCKHLESRKVKNEYRATKWDVTLVSGAINANGVINSGDKSPLIGQILNSDKPIAIASDSQKAVEVLSSLLDAREEGVSTNGIRVDSETTGDELVKKFLVSPNKMIEATKPDYVAYSPTAESGLDISTPDYFDTQYSLLYWQNTDSQLQLMGRIRHCNHRIVALPERSGSSDDLFIKSHSPEAVARAAIAYCQLQAERHTMGAVIDDEFESLEDANEFRRRIRALLLEDNKTGWEDVWATYTAMHNYERHNMQKCLQWRLEEAGHNVRVVTMGRDDEASEMFKLERDAVLDAKSTATHGAEPKESVEEANKILASFGASPEERRRAEKTLLLHHIPGIESTSSWNPKLVRKMLYDDKGWRSKLERFYLLQHPGISRNISLGFWDYAIKNNSSFFMPDKLRDRGILIWALEELNILAFINSEDSWQDDSPDVVELVRAGSHPKIIDALGGMKPNGNGGINYLNRCLNLVGIALTPRKVREGDKTVNVYKIARQSLNAQDRLDVLACIARKLEQREWYCRRPPVPEFDAENVAEASAENVPRPAISLRKNARRGTLPTPDRASNPALPDATWLADWIKAKAEGGARVAPSWRVALAEGVSQLTEGTRDTAVSLWSEISTHCSALAGGIWQLLSPDRVSELEGWGLSPVTNV